MRRRRGRVIAPGLFSGAPSGRKGMGYRKFGNFKNFQSANLIAQRSNIAKEWEELSLEETKNFKSSWNEENVQTTYKPSQSPTRKRTKPVAYVDISKCTGCRICEFKCPFNAITVDVTASVNEDLCTGCGICISICPVDAITIS
jgi:ferredoxin